METYSFKNENNGNATGNNDADLKSNNVVSKPKVILKQVKISNGADLINNNNNNNMQTSNQLNRSEEQDIFKVYNLNKKKTTFFCSSQL